MGATDFRKSSPALRKHNRLHPIDSIAL